MKRLSLLFSAALLAPPLSAQAPSATLIEHVTVVDVASGQETPDQTVRIEGERIASIAPTSAAPEDPSAQSIDAHGGFLIPGLWDMHVHVHDTEELPLYTANGVTGIRVMSGEKNEAAFRAELARTPNGPQVYLASAIVDGPGAFWPGSIIVKKPADARKAVDAIKAGGADFIKVYDAIPREAYFALADEAKKQGIDFEGHVPEAVTAQEASAAGQRSMEHLQGLALGCSSQGGLLRSALAGPTRPLLRWRVEAQALNTVDPAQCRALFDELRRNNTWQVPTLVVRRMWGRLDDRAVTGDPRIKYVDKASRRAWDDRVDPQIRRWGGQDYGLARAVFSADEHLAALLYRSGVPMMAGTDAMNPFCLPGFGLHDELALLVESGIPPLAALQMATLNPARFLNSTADEGSVSPGKLANLVLLRADPLADIRNTRQIEAVWRGGHYYDRAALDALLETAKEQAKK